MHFLRRRVRHVRGVQGQALQRGDAAREVEGQDIAEVLETPRHRGARAVRAPPRRCTASCRRSTTSASATSRSASPRRRCRAARRSAIKLSRELAKRDTGRTLYLLDEPTTGLHFEDVQRLLAVLDRLVEAGNTVLVIEHNLDVIKRADWVIDLGPVKK